METWKQKLTSRKFLAYLGAVLVIIGSFAQQLIDATALITGIVTLTIGYQTSEAIVDAARAKAATVTAAEVGAAIMATPIINAAVPA